MIRATITAILLLATPAMADQPACAVDGDTIRLGGAIFAGRCTGGQPVRLWGINARERGEPGGKQATLALSLLLRARMVSCIVRDRDRYGRHVSVCTTAAGDLSALMVISGHARDCRRYSRGAYAHLDRGAWLTEAHVRMCGR